MAGAYGHMTVNVTQEIRIQMSIRDKGRGFRGEAQVTLN